MAQPKNFGFGQEEQMIRDSLRKFLRDNAGVEKLRSLVAADHEEAYEAETPPLAWDEKLWRGLVDLGLNALAVPEEQGGAGMKMVAVASVAEEMGRFALPSPLTATLIATSVLRHSSAKGAASFLARIAGGASATLAVTNSEGSWNPEYSGVVATGAIGAKPVLNGTACFVQDARKADCFIVSARSEDGVGLYAVNADTPGLSVHPDHIVDLTRDQARVAFEAVELSPDEVIAEAGRGADTLEAALPEILTIVAADICGAAEWQLQTTAEYASTRIQFDRPLAFFQAVKHPIVDMMLSVDRARSLVYAAACAVDSDPDDAERLARMAKAAASDTAAYCSGRSIQLHGGIGFTWECDLHIYFKRQKHNQVLYGDAAWHRAHLALRT